MTTVNTATCGETLDLDNDVVFCDLPTGHGDLHEGGNRVYWREREEVPTPPRHRLDLWDGSPMDYVRRYYDVPAEVDRRILWDGEPGTIVGADGAYLRVQFDGNPGPVSLHPTWRVDYLDGKGVRGDEAGRGGLRVVTR